MLRTRTKFVRGWSTSRKYRKDSERPHSTYAPGLKPFGPDQRRFMIDTTRTSRRQLLKSAPRLKRLWPHAHSQSQPGSAVGLKPNRVCVLQQFNSSKPRCEIVRSSTDEKQKAPLSVAGANMSGADSESLSQRIPKRRIQTIPFAAVYEIPAGQFEFQFWNYFLRRSDFCIERSLKLQHFFGI